MRQKTSQDGLALLMTLLLISVLLGISAALLNVSLRQYQFSGIAVSSETAFQAASAGIECATYQDTTGQELVSGRIGFSVNGDNTATSAINNLTCMGATDNNGDTDIDGVTSGDEQDFEFTWGWGSSETDVCTQISIYKFKDDDDDIDVEPFLGRPGTCDQGTECTIIKSRGYNVACASISTNPRAIERELLYYY